mmetsp:Transcript_49610/g.107454  ORF Transcript_49610/g.107454 Transcript_49610/m.107454 type:complete len:378 (-) Transcript_49610:373-1506(-)
MALSRALEGHVGAEPAKEDTKRHERVDRLWRRGATRFAVDERREGVHNRSAEQRAAHADDDAYVLDGACDGGDECEEADDERHARALFGGSAERSLERLGQSRLGRERSAHSRERVAQADHGERVPKEDGSARRQPANHGELVVLCVVEEQVGGGVVAKGEVAEAHHGRVEQRQNGEGHAHRLAEAAHGSPLKRFVEGRRVVVRDECEAEVGDEHERSRVEPADRRLGEGGSTRGRERLQQRRRRRVRPVQRTRHHECGGVENGHTTERRGEGEGGQVLEERERREHACRERDDRGAAQHRARFHARQLEKRFEDVAEDARVDDSAREAHEGDAAVDDPRAPSTKRTAPEALERRLARHLARRADQVEGEARDCAEC